MEKGLPRLAGAVVKGKQLLLQEQRKEVNIQISSSGPHSYLTAPPKPTQPEVNQQDGPGE